MFKMFKEKSLSDRVIKLARQPMALLFNDNNPAIILFEMNNLKVYKDM